MEEGEYVAIQTVQVRAILQWDGRMLSTMFLTGPSLILTCIVGLFWLWMWIWDTIANYKLAFSWFRECEGTLLGWIMHELKLHNEERDLCLITSHQSHTSSCLPYVVSCYQLKWTTDRVIKTLFFSIVKLSQLSSLFFMESAYMMMTTNLPWHAFMPQLFIKLEEFDPWTRILY